MQPTKHGGWRRTGVAQGQSNDATRRRSVNRKHPPVLIKLNERLGLNECPYLIRWRLETPVGSIRLHHWLSNDDNRYFHDHPWDFITFVFKGSYIDESPGGEQLLKAPCFQYRPAGHQHTVFPQPTAWTLVITGPKIRQWGFWVGGKFKKANKYFLSYGHHPCN